MSNLFSEVGLLPQQVILGVLIGALARRKLWVMAGTLLAACLVSWYGLRDVTSASMGQEAVWLFLFPMMAIAAAPVIGIGAFVTHSVLGYLRHRRVP